jgi:hypothetical protein
MRHELDALSAVAISLWPALMTLSKKQVLEMKSGLNHRAVLRVRAKLADKGYLQFQRAGIKLPSMKCKV